MEISAALKELDAVAANIQKAEKIWDYMQASWPEGPAFGGNIEYENKISDLEGVLAALPAIDGWKPKPVYVLPDEIAQAHLDASDIMEHMILVNVYRDAEQPAAEIAKYKHSYEKARARVVQRRLIELVSEFDAILLSDEVRRCLSETETIVAASWAKLSDYVAEVEALLGRHPNEVPRWTDLKRHIHFAAPHDLHDIVENDWPSVREPLLAVARLETEPLPTSVLDLSELYDSTSSGALSLRIEWSRLSADDFERLIFRFISQVPGYENPAWLTATNAPDRGRDLSVERVINDPLSGTRRERVIIQCKHYQKSSISVAEVATVKEQINAWEPPRIDVLVFATSGRFTADAVKNIESANERRAVPRLEMWPESHLERLLAAYPGLIAEFGLRS